MYTVLKRSCWAIALLMNSFVFSRLRCRRRRALLKVPIMYVKNLEQNKKRRVDLSHLWRAAVGSSLSKDCLLLSLCKVRPWLLGWPLSILMPTPGYCPWILRTTSSGESSRISLYVLANKPRVPKWVYSNSFFAIQYTQMRVLIHTNAIARGICISLELMVLYAFLRWKWCKVDHSNNSS